MKALKYFAALILLSAFIDACDGNRTKATIGSTTDTSTVAGAKDTTTPGTKDTLPRDSTGKGNAEPNGTAKQ